MKRPNPTVRLRREIADLKPLVKWGMRVNSRRYLPLAEKLERLEHQLCMTTTQPKLASENSTGVVMQPEIISGTCDGCGQHHEHLLVFNGAPAVNVCMCRGCLETQQPNTKVSCALGAQSQPQAFEPQCLQAPNKD